MENRIFLLVARDSLRCGSLKRGTTVGCLYHVIEIRSHDTIILSDCFPVSGQKTTITSGVRLPDTSSHGCSIFGSLGRYSLSMLHDVIETLLP